jgi:hypothetical protein
VKFIRSIIFNPDSVDLQYMDESDVRLEGAAFVTHSMTIARDSDYDDEIAKVEDACMDLLMDVLQDWAKSLPFDPASLQGADDDDDDDDD